MVFTRNKDFYRSFFAMYIVIVFQNVITYSVNMADNIMLGSYSEAALSGVTAVNQIQFILQTMTGAIGDGLVVLASQYWGQQRTGPIHKLTATALRFGLCFMLALFTLVSLFPQGALHIFTGDAAIVAEGVSYLNIIRFTYPFFVLTNILLASLRSVETVRIAFGISCSTLLINCSINYVLIYGHFGAPRLGAQGAAIGTLAARIVELCIVLVYLACFDKKLHLRLRSLLHTDPELTRDYFRAVLPILGAGLSWGVSVALQTVVLGHMTSAAIAANSISSTLYLLIKVAMTGSAQCASVLMAKTVGTGDFARVKEYTRTLQVMFLGIGILCAVLLFFLRTPVLSLYNVSQEAHDLANTFLIIQCFVALGTAYQMPTNTGIIRGGGDTRFGFWVDTLSTWLITVPLSLCAAFVWQLPPVIVVIFLNADQIFKGIPACIKVNRYRWVKQLTRA